MDTGRALARGRSAEASPEARGRLPPARRSVSSDRRPPSRQSYEHRGQRFPIVGIGASAGGLEAFTQFLRALPPDTGMAFVLIQHLDPTHESQLPEVLSKATSMPVGTVTDRLRAEPDHVYVIPPNADMTMRDRVFALTPRTPVDRHTPIDHFFRSLAEDQRGRAIGVVLSGTGSDGTLGLRAIKGEGGISVRPGREVREAPRHAPERGRVRRLRPAARPGSPASWRGSPVTRTCARPLPSPAAPDRAGEAASTSAPSSASCAPPPASILRSTNRPASGAGSPAACSCRRSATSGPMSGTLGRRRTKRRRCATRSSSR